MDVREIKGVTSSSVNVVAYLMENGEEVLAASGVYNSNSVDPLVFDIPALGTLTNSYKITVEVNADKKVKEDDYTNNGLVYDYVENPLPDFTISNLSITTTDVQITLTNNSAQFSGNVDLLLTDNPEQSNKTTVILEPWYFQQVPLSPAENTIVTIPKSSLSNIEGQYLYAVVNPYGTVQESERNNNAIKKLVTTLSSGQTANVVNLSYSNENYVCENISFTLRNDNVNSALNLKLSLLNSLGIVISGTQIHCYLPPQKKE